MPIKPLALDDRRYQDLRDEALARRQIHTPEWTSSGESDPGVTLIELFAFLTENLLYRANRIPEANRLKYLELLGIPLAPATPAQGLVEVINERGPRQAQTIGAGVEVRAGAVPFFTTRGLDVLPIEGRVFFKRRLVDRPAELVAQYRMLYASYTGKPLEDSDNLDLYETVPFETRADVGVDLVTDTVDGALWLALLVRASEVADNDEGWRALREDLAGRIAGKVLSVGVVPAVDERTRVLAVAADPVAATQPALEFAMPSLPPDALLPNDASQRTAQYRRIEVRSRENVLVDPGVVEIPLPANKADLRLWLNLDPLEPGAGDFPPMLDDPRLAARAITWIRLRSATGGGARIQWAGINAAPVIQSQHVQSERLAPGDGQPEQSRTLARRPVVPGTVALTVIANGTVEHWKPVADLFDAGAEVPVEDLRRPPGAPAESPRPAEVFTVDAESGTVRFGDGLRGKRPPLDAEILASYAYTLGVDGNVAAGAIGSATGLPPGYTVHNPVRTWGGAEAETVADGERQIPRYLQHRDRLVTAADFRTIALRTPGVDVARVDVLPAFHPSLSPNEPGDAPGVVTLMVIPSFDAKRPDAPEPDRLFLDAICRYLEPRRLVTTELVLRGPIYKPIWISVGIDVRAGADTAVVREAVKQRLLAFLSPLPDAEVVPDLLTLEREQGGWPLRKEVIDRELAAEASRVDGVLFVNDVVVAASNDTAQPRIPMRGLQLPRVDGIAVAVGEPTPLDALQPSLAGDRRIIPVPVVPEFC